MASATASPRAKPTGRRCRRPPTSWTSPDAGAGSAPAPGAPRSPESRRSDDHPVPQDARRRQRLRGDRPPPPDPARGRAARAACSRRMCDRRRGVGADGVLLLERERRRGLRDALLQRRRPACRLLRQRGALPGALGAWTWDWGTGRRCASRPRPASSTGVMPRTGARSSSLFGTVEARRARSSGSRRWIGRSPGERPAPVSRTSWFRSSVCE